MDSKRPHPQNSTGAPLPPVNVPNSRGVALKNDYLLVTGYPPNLSRNKLHNFLSAYGKITTLQFHPRSSKVLFSPDTYELAWKAVLGGQVSLGQHGLVCRIVNTHVKKKSPVNNTITPKNLASKLKPLSNFDMQINRLLQELQMPYYQMQMKFGALCHDLEKVLSMQYPQCRALPFGSTVTGLAFRTSDLDVYIQVGEHPQFENDENRAAKLVSASRKSIYRRPDLFNNIVIITKTKTPIVKCVHVPTGINCDFNFKNLLGVCNSSLLSYFISSDRRLQPLLIIIKYWAFSHDLSGPGKLTNYSLVMLVIFYLQHLPVPLLPPISQLQTPEYDNIIENWNGGYNFHSECFLRTSNSEPLPKLLLGFFKFCTSFEFALQVVSPFMGFAIPKCDFANINSLPNAYFRYKNLMVNGQITPLRIDSCLCIQDPFEHNHNLTTAVNLNVIQDLQACCAVGAKICDELLLKQPCDWKDLLPRIFIEKPQVPKTTIDTSNNVFRMSIQAGAFINISQCPNNPSTNSVDRENTLRQLWFDRVHDTLIHLLTKVMRFELTIVRNKNEPQSKTPRKDDLADVHADVVESYEIRCIGRYCVYQSRKATSKAITRQPNTTFVDHEIAITDHIIEKFYDKVKFPATSIINATFVVTSQKQPSRVSLEIKNNDPKLSSQFITCATFLNRWMPSWVTKGIAELEKIHVEPEAPTNNSTKS